jgi:hypothetical protein
VETCSELLEGVEEDKNALSGGEISTNSLLHLDEVFDILESERRRATIRHVSKSDEFPVSTVDLSKSIALDNTDHSNISELSSSDYKTLYVSLQQTHLPKLDEFDIIDFNSSESGVQGTGDSSRFEIFDRLTEDELYVNEMFDQNYLDSIVNDERMFSGLRSEPDFLPEIKKGDELISKNNYFNLLKNNRRRSILGIVNSVEDDISLKKLSETVSCLENGKALSELDERDFKTSYIVVYQNHLPKLEEHGIVSLEDGNISVEDQDKLDALTLMIDEDLSSGEQYVDQNYFEEKLSLKDYRPGFVDKIMS